MNRYIDKIEEKAFLLKGEFSSSKETEEWASNKGRHRNYVRERGRNFLEVEIKQ